MSHPATPRRCVAVVVGGCAALAVVVLWGIAAGPSSLTLAADESWWHIWWRIMTGNLPMQDATIVYHIRVPRIVTGIAVGGALSVAGVTFQAILRNPLADPFVLGVSSGGALGAVLILVSGVGMGMLGQLGLPVAAWIGSLLAIWLVSAIAKQGSSMPVPTLLLAGVIVNAFCTAVMLFITAMVDYTKVSGIMFWLMGSLRSVSTVPFVVVLSVVLFGVGAMLWKAQALNVMLLGEETAQQLGVDADRVKRFVFVVASLMVGAVVSISGLIGFVGLMVPHTARLLLGTDHRLVLPASALFGAAFLVAADTLARTALAPNEIPVGVVTALCGGPYFLWLLRRRRGMFFV